MEKAVQRSQLYGKGYFSDANKLDFEYSKITIAEN